MPTIIENPTIEIAPDLLAELEHQVEEQGQVIVHCLHATTVTAYIRIWPTTYLYDIHTDHASHLVHAEKISYYPIWQKVRPGEAYFTLIFSGLPKSCTVFDLHERCDNEHGAFKVFGINRNKTDVYFVQL